MTMITVIMESLNNLFILKFPNFVIFSDFPEKFQFWTRFELSSRSGHIPYISIFIYITSIPIICCKKVLLFVLEIR